jgi:hypothetical protein
MFAGVAPRLISVGYGPMERAIWAAIGLGYLIGAPIAAFVLFFLLRAAADLVDLWIDSQVAAEKTADLLQRQLVPGVIRIGQLIEKTNEALASAGSAKVPVTLNAAPNEARSRAIESVREAMKQERWEHAKRLARAAAEQFPDSIDATELTAQVETTFTRRVQSLREMLQQAEQAGDCDSLLNLRDRLSAYLDGTELYQVDRRVAHRISQILREALAAGRAKEVVQLAERLVDAVGDSTQEGAQVRASLPTLRRSAGLCPECGQPSDPSRARCPACEAKRTSQRPTQTAAKK